MRFQMLVTVLDLRRRKFALKKPQNVTNIWKHTPFICIQK